jgi:Ala-tRNA(Pro) deacylase
MLENYQIPYVHTRHPIAYRAMDVAEAEHLPAYMLAKTVIVRSPNGYAMAVLPADCKIDLEQLAATLNLKYLALATEEEVRELFPESEVGAMPPFGALFDIPVYFDVRLAGEPYILFSAGTHRDAIHMSVADYFRVVDPSIIQFAYPELRLPLTEAMTTR